MKRILLSLMTIALVSGTAFGATRAFFSDAEISRGNIFAAGTIDISVDGENPWSKTYPMVLDKPSQVNYINFTIENIGTNPANIWKRISNVNTSGGMTPYPCTCGGDENLYVSSEPECYEGTNGCQQPYVERKNVDSYMVYDLYVCEGGLTNNGGTCDVDQTTGRPTGENWVPIISEANEVRVDNINGVWIKLKDALAPGAKLAISQSYHLTAWTDAAESDITNWAQGDVMTFDIELEARQTTAPAPGSSQLATLDLRQKDPVTWSVISGGASGTLSYNTAGNTFNYSFTASGLKANTGYSLIYYADPWPGNHPGALIDTMMTDENGNVAKSGNVELGMDLPQPGDANYPTGAKIQLVLSSDYDATNKKLTAWNPSEYLFEMKLITYEDTNN